MSFPLAATWICGDVECSTVFDVRACRNACPRCQSTATFPIESFFRARDGRAHTRATVAELVRPRVLKSA